MTNETANKIEREGFRIAEEACCWIDNEGLEADDALTEAAQTYGDLGAVFTALLSGGYISEEAASETILAGLEEYHKER